MRLEDYRSLVWSRFTEDMNERLTWLRAQNDNLSHDPIKTSAIRGQIAEVKRILALAEHASSGSASASEEEVPGLI